MGSIDCANDTVEACFAAINVSLIVPCLSEVGKRRMAGWEDQG